MFNTGYLRTILFGNIPEVKNLRVSANEELHYPGLPMGTMILGRQGSGKTMFLAKHLLKYLKQFPRRAVFILDWSGSLANALLKLILMEPDGIREELLARVVYDELGNPSYVIPLPEFSDRYGSLEEQVQRVSSVQRPSRTRSSTPS